VKLVPTARGPRNIDVMLILSKYSFILKHGLVDSPKYGENVRPGMYANKVF
jgi:hypothetical protein